MRAKTFALRMRLDRVEELLRAFRQSYHTGELNMMLHVEGVHVLQEGIEFRSSR